ncbi:MAG: DUF418 domain-containing protein [Phycisphaerales bacterium]
MNEQFPGDDDIVQEVATETPPTERPSDEALVIGPPMEPVQEPERIHALDVLRGFAIFGIFMVNIAFFSMPLAKLIDPSLLADATASDQVAHAIVRSLFEYKFVSLFSMLFGMGLIVQMQRAKKRNRPFVGLYLRRTFILMALGLAHALLLWYGDILFIYSIVALLALWCRRLSPRVTLALCAGALAMSVLLSAGFTLLGVVFGPGANQATQVQSSEPIQTSESSNDDVENIAAEETVDQALQAESDDPWARYKTVLNENNWQPGDPAWIELDLMAYKEGPMMITLVQRAMTFLIMLVLIVIIGFGFRVVGMFLLGMALMKLNFFSAERRRWHWAFCILGLTIGLAGELFMVWSYHRSNYQLGWIQGGAEIFHHISSFALCLGYVGTITLIVRSGLLKWLTYAFSCVGRTALTNYLLQTIVATYIMYWWGLGLFNDVSRPQQLAMVVGIYAAQLVLSVLYLRVFSIGPFEWLWRSLTYLKLQPILRRASTTVP